MLCMAGEGEEKPIPRSMVTTTGYWYSDAPTTQHHMLNQIQQQQHSFEPNNNNNNNQEIYNLTSGMDMIGWNNKSFFNNNKPSSSSKAAVAAPLTSHHEFYHQRFSTDGGGDGGGGGDWVEEDPSLRCVFPCEGNERPSQGLSLSLSSSNPSAIGLQSFELRHHDNDLRAHHDLVHHHHHHQHQQQQHDGFLGKGGNNLSHPPVSAGYFEIRNSKYLGAVQELLNEFCCLGTSDPNNNNFDQFSKMKAQKNNQWEDENNGSSSSSKKPSLGSLDLLELQKKKAKLLQMLEEVDRRYKHYCDQMKAVVSSFEAVAGNGAANVYSALASKAMSRHFRSLRDGIVSQIKAIKKATSDKDTAAPGTTKGETPRLRILDQTLRQQRAFQQMTMMETHPWRPQRGLPERSVSVLRAWLFEHFLHPYPSDVDKHILARQTGLSRSQVSNWFINARVRLWKPMVEEMYLEETKEQEDNLAIGGGATSDDNGEAAAGRLHNPRTADEDQKPNLVRIDSECISSIINNNDHNNHNNNNNDHDQPIKCVNGDNWTRGGDHHHSTFGGPMGLDFSSYNYAAELGGGGGKGGGGGSGVSLTLGLQQQAAAGLGAFSQSSSSLFYPREQIEECQTVPYSLLADSEVGQNLPYRNLMGAQLLHDLAG